MKKPTTPRFGSALLAAVASFGLAIVSAVGSHSRPLRAPETAPSAARRALGHLPITFVENRGQIQGDAPFYLPGKDRVLYFHRGGMTVRRENGRGAWVFRLGFVGGDPNVAPVSTERSAGVVNIFRGDEKRWRTDIGAHTALEYRQVWAGIDVAYQGAGDRLKYEFRVAPGADPGRVRLSYQGIDSARVLPDGTLEISTPAGSFVDEKPLVYQERDGHRQEVPSSYWVRQTQGAWEYGFHLGAYDPKLPLVIDPATFVYVSFIGGAADDAANGIAVDPAGHVYVVGTTASAEGSMPVKVGPDLTYNSGELPSDAFVCKLAADGSSFIWLGYIGGTGIDTGNGIAVDAAERVYVCGAASDYTDLTDNSFPAIRNGDRSFNNPGRPGRDGWLLGIGATGDTLFYGGFMGGSLDDVANAIAVGADGRVYFVGSTNSPEDSFPVRLGPQTTYPAGASASGFIGCFGSLLEEKVYGGYIGGAGQTFISGVTVNSAGQAIVVGATNSTQASLPVTVGPDLTYNDSGAAGDAFVALVAPDGLRLDACGYIGGQAADEGRGVAVDSSGGIYVCGSTASTQSSFPVLQGPSLVQRGLSDAFVTKLTPGAESIVYSGFIGGAGEDRALSIAVDDIAGAVVVGATQSAGTQGFPLWAGPDLRLAGKQDAFVAQVVPAGPFLRFCGYIGGENLEEARSVAIGPDGSIVVTGVTNSTEAQTFPVLRGPIVEARSQVEAFVAAIDPARPPYGGRAPNVSWPSPSAAGNLTNPVTIAFSISDTFVNSWDLSLDGKLFTTGTTREFSTSLPLPAGTHLLELVVRNTSAFRVLSRTFAVGTRDRVPPNVTIRSPRDDARTPSPVPILIDILDDSVVSWTLTFDGAQVLLGQARGRGAVAAEQAATTGVHKMVIDVLDGRGNRAKIERTFTVGAGGSDVTPPVLQITSPPSTATVQPNPVKLKVNINDDSDVTWVAKVDGAQIETGTRKGVDAVNLLKTLSAGNHTFQVTVTDAAGNVATQERTFTAGGASSDRTAPKITFVKPKPGARSASPVLIQANISDASDVSWDLKVDNVIVQSGVTRGTNAVNVRVNIPAGEHDLRIDARDGPGNTSFKSQNVFVSGG